MKKLLNITLVFMLVFCGSFVAFSGVSEVQAVAAEETVYASSDITTYGGAPMQTIEERIDYSYKVEEEYYNPYEMPQYLSSYTCGITAGGALIGHFDRMYEELIPNHTGMTFMGKYFYGTQGAAVNAMYDSLYTAMGATSAGVTIDGYKSGLKSYVASRGRTATTFRSMIGTDTLNLTASKTALKDGKLLSVFVDGYNVIDFGQFRTFDKYDEIEASVFSGAHVMIAYGYLVVKYYNDSDVCFRTDKYLYVASGLSGVTLGLICMSRNTKLDDCYITNIY